MPSGICSNSAARRRANSSLLNLSWENAALENARATRRAQPEMERRGFIKFFLGLRLEPVGDNAHCKTNDRRSRQQLFPVRRTAGGVGPKIASADFAKQSLK